MADETLIRLPDAPYAFRPAKRIQRMMFCDALRLLRALRPMEEYRYVGLGHWQFVDFELMRREVGVRDMVSIEINTNEKARFEENRPFAEVDLRFGSAFEVLQELDLSIPTIAWLDYLWPLRTDVLNDLGLLVEALPAGSVVAATVNCHPGKEDERLRRLIAALGAGVVPGDVREEDLDRNGLPRVQRQILVEQLSAVAGARPVPATLKQFMFLHYADRAPMMFWAALLVDETIETEAAAVPFERLEQFREGDAPLEVSVPWLTTREVIALNEKIEVGDAPTLRGLKASECKDYARLHRWYPPVPLPL